jgi:hypothetical protein
MTLHRICLFAAWLLLSGSGTHAQTNVALQPFTIDHRKALRWPDHLAKFGSR